MNPTEAAAALGITVLAFVALSSNPQFPYPVSSGLWDPNDVAAFASLMATVVSNNWAPALADYPTCNWKGMSQVPNTPFLSAAGAGGVRY